MSDTRKIVDQIEAGKLTDAKDTIFDTIKSKTAEVVDMKRVEMQVDWNNNEQDLETDNSRTEWGQIQTS